MAYNFKKINELPVVEAMKKDLNVFVEDGGKMAKIAAESLVPEDVALKSDVDALSEEINELKNSNNGGGSGSKSWVIHANQRTEEMSANFTLEDLVRAISEDNFPPLYFVCKLYNPDYPDASADCVTANVRFNFVTPEGAGGFAQLDDVSGVMFAMEPGGVIYWD